MATEDKPFSFDPKRHLSPSHRRVHLSPPHSKQYLYAPYTAVESRHHVKEPAHTHEYESRHPFPPLIPTTSVMAPVERTRDENNHQFSAHNSRMIMHSLRSPPLIGRSSPFHTLSRSPPSHASSRSPPSQDIQSLYPMSTKADVSPERHIHFPYDARSVSFSPKISIHQPTRSPPVRSPPVRSPPRRESPLMVRRPSSPVYHHHLPSMVDYRAEKTGEIQYRPISVIKSSNTPISQIERTSKGMPPIKSPTLTSDIKVEHDVFRDVGSSTANLSLLARVTETCVSPASSTSVPYHEHLMSSPPDTAPVDGTSPNNTSEETGSSEVSSTDRKPGGKPGRKRKRGYVYNPKPLKQRQKTTRVPGDKKTEEYWETRRRNNEAAKISRLNRRKKEMESLSELLRLREENEVLRENQVSLERKNATLEEMWRAHMLKCSHSSTNGLPPFNGAGPSLNGSGASLTGSNLLLSRIQDVRTPPPSDQD